MRSMVRLLVVGPLLSILPIQAGSVGARQIEDDGGAQRPAIYAYSPPNLFYHNIGLLQLMVTNVGFMGTYGYVDTYGAGWRGGEYLFTAALWVGALASDNLPYVTTGATGNREHEFRPSLDPVDTIYPSYEGVVHGNRAGFSTSPDDDRDGLLDEDFLNGKDDDGDGRIDEDYAAISQQMLACEYWDYASESISSNPEHHPLNLRVQQRSMAWSTEGSNEFVGLDFKIVNDGFETLRALYIGFFVDSDVGPKDADKYWDDDAGAFYSRDTLVVDDGIRMHCLDQDGSERNCGQVPLHLDICYMYDVPDNGSDAAGGDVPGRLGGMFLGHTTDPLGVNAPETVRIHTAAFFSRTAPYPAGDPRNDFERYDLLSKGTRIARPVDRPNDYRYVISAGPFKELDPGGTLEFQTALVIGMGRDGMIQNAIGAQRIYNGQWRDVDNNPETSHDGKETCLFVLDPTEPHYWNDPCDSLAQPRLVKDAVCLPQNYVDNDCNCCTPLYRTPEEDATEGFEQLIHWVGTVAPPPPLTNIDPRKDPSLRVFAPGADREVVLQWDNGSELLADPVQQKILFAGYRIWRVEGWRRPIGSTGPSPDDWQLIADLSLYPPDKLGGGSPFYLTKYLCRPGPPCFGPDSTVLVPTGSSVPGQEARWYYPVGRYAYVDREGVKNGMVYFYDVTAYSAWTDMIDVGGGQVRYRYQELSGRPTAAERDAVVPEWGAKSSGDEIIVVPDPYVRGGQPAGWDLTPSDRDPTGTKIAFANLPRANCTVKIYTMSGDMVQTLEKDGRRDGGGTVFWNLISRNGQDIVSGVYLYSVECRDCPGGVKGCGSRKIGRFTVIR